jgi:putative transposase
MTELFRNKYRISSTRLQTWNYANAGMYFVTICTAHRLCYFGKIAGKQMHLSALGGMAENEWIKTIEMRPDMNLELGEFVVMPNHFHGIIIIGDNKYNGGNNGKNAMHGRGDTMHGVPTQMNPSYGRDVMHHVSTTTGTNIPHGRDATHGVSTAPNNFGPQSKNLASIIRGYKSAVTTFARKNNMPFAWQPRFHEHIIRSADEYSRISNYINNNPAEWQNDKFYLNNNS